ncbi:hypothetical protein FQR65_LT18311 [Abscondita terminalis]|nr:hypothetical protein FQR65_LT18311 [Abscondita terminalis]
MNKFYLLLLFHIYNAVALRKKFDEIQLCTEKVMKQIFIEGSSVINVFMEGNMITIADEYPHVVVNISNEIQGVYDKHGNNFILQARTIDMIEHLIVSFLNHDLFTFRENTRGRFIIITQEKNISEVFLLVWELFAINSVVLYYDDADKNKELIIYTSNPFSNSNRCGTQVHDIHAEFCDTDFIIKFPKAIKNFGGCPFLFGSSNREDTLSEINPFVYSLNSTLTEIQLMLNITIRHLYVTGDIHNRVKFIERHYFGSFFFERLASDDRSNIFFYDDFLWIGTKAEQRLNAIFTPFTVETWILIVVVFVSVVLIWWRGLLLEKFKYNQLQALFQSFSEICSLLFGVGISILPKLASLKLLILFYLIYIIHIQTAYTSDMINTLVVPHYEHVVSNLHDLVETGIPTLIQDFIYKSFFSSDLKNFHVYNEIKRNFIRVYSYNETRNYSKQKLFIVLPKQYYMFSSNSYPKKITNKFISNDLTGSFRISFFMLRGNYLLSSINRVITFLREFGFYEKAYDDGYRLRSSTKMKLLDYTFDISEVEEWNNPLRINDFIVTGTVDPSAASWPQHHSRDGGRFAKRREAIIESLPIQVTEAQTTVTETTATTSTSPAESAVQTPNQGQSPEQDEGALLSEDIANQLGKVSVSKPKLTAKERREKIKQACEAKGINKYDPNFKRKQKLKKKKAEDPTSKPRTSTAQVANKRQRYQMSN